MRCKISNRCDCGFDYVRMETIILSLQKQYQKGEITRVGALELLKDLSCQLYCILACTAAHYPDLEIRTLAHLEMARPIYRKPSFAPMMEKGAN